MIFDTRFKIQFDQSAADFEERLPWILIGLSILLGTVTVALLVIYLGDRCFGGSLTRPWTKLMRDHDQTIRKSRKSYGRLFIIVVAILLFLGGCTCAASIMGLNIIGIFLGYGILALVVNNMFGSPLRCVGAYILITFTDKIEEDFWVYVKSQGVEGRIRSINILDIELEYIDENCNPDSIETIKVPTYFFNDMTVGRRFRREKIENHCPKESFVPRQKTTGLRMTGAFSDL